MSISIKTAPELKSLRQQLKNAAAIMGDLVPIIIEIMINNPNELWGIPVIRF